MGIVDKISAKIHGNDEHDSTEPSTQRATHDPSKIHEGKVIDPNPNVGTASHAGHKNAAVGTTNVGTTVGTDTAGISHGEQTGRHITHPNAETGHGISGTGHGVGTTGHGVGATGQVGGTGITGTTGTTESTYGMTGTHGVAGTHGVTGAHGATGATHGGTGTTQGTHFSTRSSDIAGTHGATEPSGHQFGTSRHETLPSETFGTTGNHSGSHYAGAGQISGNVDHSTAGIKSTGVDSRDKSKVNEMGEPIIEKNAVTQEVRQEKNKGNTMMANIAQSADEFDRKVGRVFNQETVSGADKGIGTKMLHKKEEKHAEKERENKHDSAYTSTTHPTTHSAGLSSHHGGEFGTTSGTAFDGREGKAVTGSHPTTVHDIETPHQSGRLGFANVIPSSNAGGTHSAGIHGQSGTRDQTMDSSIPVKSSLGNQFEHRTDTDHRDTFGHGGTQGHTTFGQGQTHGHDDSGLHSGNYGTHSSVLGHDESMNIPRTAGEASFTTGNTALDEKVARLDVKGQQKAQDAYNKGYQDGIRHH